MVERRKYNDRSENLTGICLKRELLQTTTITTNVGPQKAQIQNNTSGNSYCEIVNIAVGTLPRPGASVESSSGVRSPSFSRHCSFMVFPDLGTSLSHRSKDQYSGGRSE